MTLRLDHKRNISGKSGNFTNSSSGEEVKNVSTNQKRDQPFWIWNCSENVQHLCRNPTRTLVINLAAIGMQLSIEVKNVKTLMDTGGQDRWKLDTTRSEKVG